MNYNTLGESIQQYMQRSDANFIKSLPQIIEFGLLRIYNNAKDIGFDLIQEVLVKPEPIVLFRLTATQIQKPTGWVETLSIFATRVVGGIITEILPRPFEYCATYLSSSFSGKNPKFYYDLNTNVQDQNQINQYYRYWAIVPNISEQMSFEIRYRGIPTFNVQNPDNFLTQRHPQLLLYSCLIEACLAVGNEDKRQAYISSYNEELNIVLSLTTNRDEK